MNLTQYMYAAASVQRKRRQFNYHFNNLLNEIIFSLKFIVGG